MLCFNTAQTRFSQNATDLWCPIYSTKISSWRTVNGKIFYVYKWAAIQKWAAAGGCLLTNGWVKCKFLWAYTKILCSDSVCFHRRRCDALETAQHQPIMTHLRLNHFKSVWILIEWRLLFALFVGDLEIAIEIEIDSNTHKSTQSNGKHCHRFYWSNNFNNEIRTDTYTHISDGKWVCWCALVIGLHAKGNIV